MLSASARSCHPQTLHKALSVLCLLPWQVLPAPQSSYSFECASVMSQDVVPGAAVAVHGQPRREAATTHCC